MAAKPGTPNIKDLLRDGKSPDAYTSSVQEKGPFAEQPIPLEAFLAEWAAVEFCPSRCRDLVHTHPLAYARGRMQDLAAALREKGYVKG